MQTQIRTNPWLILFLSGLMFPPSTGTAAADDVDEVSDPISVTVTLSDGTQLSATPDAETDDEFLVLRYSSPGILLKRSVLWENIAAAAINEQELSADALKEKLSELTLDEGISPLASFAKWDLDDDSATTDQVVTISRSPQSANTGHTVARPTQIESLEVFAATANWDRDAAVDGIVMLVRPLNSIGQVVPVTGHLTVDLFGDASLKPGGNRGDRLSEAFPSIGKWSQRVSKKDFLNDGATYRFPFRRTNPEFNHELQMFGLTHARLFVAGQGSFEASDAMTQIQPFSPYRESLQQRTGKRFLPAEHVTPHK